MQQKGATSRSGGGGIGGRKLSLSLTTSGCSQRGVAGFFGMAAMDDPRNDLRAGIFDVSIASADAGGLLQLSRSSNNGSIGDELRLVELRVN